MKKQSKKKAATPPASMVISDCTITAGRDVPPSDAQLKAVEQVAHAIEQQARANRVTSEALAKLARFAGGPENTYGIYISDVNNGPSVEE